jgi:hypothetical protein
MGLLMWHGSPCLSPYVISAPDKTAGNHRVTAGNPLADHERHVFPLQLLWEDTSQPRYWLNSKVQPAGVIDLLKGTKNE